MIELPEWIRELLDKLRDRILRELGDRIDNLRSVIDNILRSIGQALDGLWERIAQFQNSIIERLEAWTETIWTALNDTYYLVSHFLDRLAESVLTGVSELVDKVKDTLASVAASVVEFGHEIAERITGALQSALKWIAERWQALISFISESYERIAASVSETWGRAVEAIRTGLQAILERIQQALVWLIDKLLDLIAWSQERALPWLATTWSHTSESGKKRWQAAKATWHALVTGDERALSSSLMDFLAIEDEHDLVGIFLGLALFVLMIPTAVGTILSPAVEALTQEARRRNPNWLPDLSALAEAAARGYLSEAQYSELAARAGLDAENASLLRQLSYRRLDPEAVRVAYLRGQITEAQHDAYLRQLGYPDAEIAQLKMLYFIIPGPSDLVRMAVREAFSPQVAERFGQYEDFPEEFAAWCERQGLSREWARRYWAAHWDLPSPQMGFEMLHRGIISADELTLLLRALDVMPYWRDKIIKLSYAPYTRVDLRRMYSMGLISEQDVFRNYLDLGYDEAHAKNLTEFTVRYYSPEEETDADRYRELTREIYVTAYKRDVIDRAQARAYLVGIGYRDPDAEIILAIADAELALKESQEDVIPLRDSTRKLVLDAYARGIYERAEAVELLSDLRYTQSEIEWYVAQVEYQVSYDLKKAYVEAVHTQYVERSIDRAEASVALGKIFPSSRELSSLFERWEIEREARTRKPTEAQFRAALQRGLISVEEYAEELRGLGYPEKYVDMLVKLAGAR